jgi:hypothetical protein
LATISGQHHGKNDDLILHESFVKVLEILGQESRERTLEYIKHKYGFQFENDTHTFTSREIEESIMELFGIGGQLIIEIIRADIQRRT